MLLDLEQETQTLAISCSDEKQIGLSGEIPKHETSDTQFVGSDPTWFEQCDLFSFPELGFTETKNGSPLFVDICCHCYAVYSQEYRVVLNLYREGSKSLQYCS